MSELKNAIVLADNLQDIATLIAEIDDTQYSNEEWNEIIQFAADTADVTVDELLQKVENIVGYNYFLENQAEEEYWRMMNAEDPRYGCDIDENP